MRDPFLDYVTNNDIDMVRSYLETYYHTASLKNERGETDVQIAARPGFRQYETADVIVNRIHTLLFANREILKQCCTKRMLVPLIQMNGERTHDKRHVICFLRRVCTQYDYGFVVRKRSWRRMSVYEYGVTAVLKSAR